MLLIVPSMIKTNVWTLKSRGVDERLINVGRFNTKFAYHNHLCCQI
jgi:hypothetical protein